MKSDVSRVALVVPGLTPVVKALSEEMRITNTVVRGGINSTLFRLEFGAVSALEFARQSFWAEFAHDSNGVNEESPYGLKGDCLPRHRRRHCHRRHRGGGCFLGGCAACSNQAPPIRLILASGKVYPSPSTIC